MSDLNEIRARLLEQRNRVAELEEVLAGERIEMHRLEGEMRHAQTIVPKEEVE